MKKKKNNPTTQNLYWQSFKSLKPFLKMRQNSRFEVIPQICPTKFCLSFSKHIKLSFERIAWVLLLLFSEAIHINELLYYLPEFKVHSLSKVNFTSPYAIWVFLVILIFWEDCFMCAYKANSFNCINNRQCYLIKSTGLSVYPSLYNTHYEIL